MKKPLIGITSSFSNISERFFLNIEYVKAIKKAGGIPVIIPYLKNDIQEIISKINGVLLSGGGDILPKFFKEEPELTKLALPERDLFEIKLVRECFKRKIPVFGICRGCQVINVAMGGNLIQDIKGKIEHYQSAPAKEPTHTIIIEKDSILYEIFKKEKIMVNSFHHQAIKKVGNNLFISAKAKDGIIEAVESKKHPFFLGVQFHIEYLIEDKRFLNLFKFFISKAKEI